MNKKYEQTVKDLVHLGHAIIPIDAALLESADSAARIFLRAEVEQLEAWKFVRDDGTELGIVEEKSPQGDLQPIPQLALSFSHDLSKLRVSNNPHIKACLGAVAVLYRDMRNRVTDFCHELQRHCGATEVASRIRSTFETVDERATTMLLRSSVFGSRSFTQPSSADSVFSIFFCSEECEIWIKDEMTQKWEFRSPPYGSALLFWGRRVEELDNPAFKPAIYRMEGRSGKPLCGTIMHVQMKKEIPPSDVLDNVYQLIS